MKIGVGGKLEGDHAARCASCRPTARGDVGRAEERADADFAVMSGGGVRDSMKAAISPTKTCSRYSRSAAPLCMSI